MGRLAALSGVRDPVLGAAVDRRDAFVAHHKAADVAAFLVDIFLRVKDRMMIAAEGYFVFENRFRCVTVIDLREQPSPRADRRLQHHGVTHLFDGLNRRIFGKGDAHFGLRHFVLFESDGGQDLIAADGRHLPLAHNGPVPRDGRGVRRRMA